MTWVRSDDNKPLNRKVRPLSDGAYRLDDHALHFCARHETDGLIYQADFEEITLGIRGKQHRQYVAELVTANLWHETGEVACPSDECPAHNLDIPAGAWAKHDYFTHNKSHEELEQERRSQKEARSKGGRVSAANGQLQASRNLRWPQARQPDGSLIRPQARQPDTQPDGQPEAESGSRGSGSRPVPSRPVIVSNETIMSHVPVDPEVEGLVDLLSKVLRERGVKFRAGKEWRTAADRLLRLDKRDFQEAAELLVWATGHHFWAPNILSLPKFREKYDQLRLQREREFTQPVRSNSVEESAARSLREAGVKF